MRFEKILGYAVLIALLAGVALATPISNDKHLTVQVRNSSGSILTGTYNFTVNISTSSDCQTVVYSHNNVTATDSAGVVSLYLPSVNLLYNVTYWGCYYRNETLKSADKIVPSWYAERAQRVNTSIIDVDSSLDFSGYTLTASYILGVVGGWDVRGDPWYFSGSDMRLAEDLDVDKNVNIDGDLVVDGWITSGNWTNVSILASQVSDFEEEAQDSLETLVAGNTETGITVTYDDSGNDLNFVVDFSNYYTQAIVDGIVSGNLSDYDTSAIIDGKISGNLSDYDLSTIVDGKISGNLSDYDTSTIIDGKIAGNLTTNGTGINLTNGVYSILLGYYNQWNEAYGWGDWSGEGFISATLTQAQVEDYAGGMFSGNTETGIALTYQVGDNTVDAVVDFSNHDTSTIVDSKISGNLSDYDLSTIVDSKIAGNVSNYQPLEATLTDIADGTINENLVNTANPWADNEVSDTLTCSLITVADTTDTTSYVALWESATGNLAPKSDAGITYNAGTGVLTATGFAGPLTGAVTGNAATASALAANGANCGAGEYPLGVDDNGAVESCTDATTEITTYAQPLEATLTDIADGTIAENLVNTAYPWADNEVSDTLTCSILTDDDTYALTASAETFDEDVTFAKNITVTNRINMKDDQKFCLGDDCDVYIMFNNTGGFGELG